ncbi:MAG: hypothetical protein CR982_01635 [Candidatus Cloacimonadota bacterium]|nr:MAG: hypothetical protein CR982_01635 [Candidatus Cloacimonadota bacterium]PIE82085.1 MAG: hypothetical protein CSA15_00090 [Candidatus Delongbacteria bacterium]
MNNQFESLVGLLKEYSKKNNMRHSKEREKILFELCDSENLSSHFDADELFAQIKVKKIDVSRATIFRNLNLFVEAGILRRTKLGESHFHYEICGDEKDRHEHLVCTKCGKLIEFVNPVILEEQRKIAEKNGFKILDYKHEIYGLCKDCVE